jgi:hypothetical protein
MQSHLHKTGNQTLVPLSLFNPPGGTYDLQIRTALVDNVNMVSKMQNTYCVFNIPGRGVFPILSEFIFDQRSPAFMSHGISS